MPIIGRDEERARLRAVLDGLRAGRGVAIVVRGEPGIGKTALLEDLRSAAGGVRILGTRAVESESQLAFAGLADIVRPVLDRRHGLPEAQRVAFEAALALGPPVVPDRFAAYAATLGMFGAVAAEGPLLVLIDDAHWLDTPSQEALLFAARRLQDDPVAIVATSREGPVEGLDLTGIEELRLAPLDETSSRRVLAERAEDLVPDVAESLLRVARGNPLALVELPRALTPEERSGRAPLPRSPRAGEELTRAYRTRIERLGPGARRAVLLAAIGEEGDALTSALAAAGGGPADLQEAEEAGLLTLGPDVVEARHPVIRSVALELASPAERRAAHRALAGALDPERAIEARAWHLAEAAVGPDEAAAQALEAAAWMAAGRTGYAAAMAALERSAEVGEGGAGAAGRRLMAARMAMAAGRFERALALTADDASATPGAAHLRGMLMAFAGDPEGGARLLVQEAERVADADPALAAAMTADAVLPRSMMGRCRDAERTAQRAYALAARAPAFPPNVLGYLGGAATLRGRARFARGFLERLDAHMDALDPLTVEGQSLLVSQVWRIWIGDHDAFAPRIEALIDRARAAGAVGFLAFPLAWACELDFRAGRWTRARARGEEAVALLAETRQHGALGYAVCMLAMVEAGLGLSDPARGRASAAREAAAAVGARSVEVYSATALGFDALGGGDPEAAVRDLAPLPGLTDELGLIDPGVSPWHPDLIEGLARLGRVAEARRVLATLAEQAYGTGGLWARAVTSRCRGLIDDDIDRHFGEALAWHRMAPTPFERARTELAYGARLRRAGRRTDARARLEGALATFEELGARPWARQAREEIAAGGARLRPRGAGPAGEDLSPRELQVALAVSEGATNREAAARLFLSEKTIERHLGSVYRKLGLRSRTELARRFAAGAGGQAESTPGAGPVISSESQ